MAERAETDIEEIIAALRAAKGIELSTVLSRYKNAEAYKLWKKSLYPDLLRNVQEWLCDHAGSERAEAANHFDAAFHLAVDDLVFVAAFVLRALKQRVGEELSPSLFAKYCYEVAHEILHWDSFEDETIEWFDGVFDPRPLPLDDDLRTFAKGIILDFLPTQPKTVSRHTLSREVMLRYAEKYGWRRARDAAQHATYDALRELESVGKVQRTKWGNFVIGFADSDANAIVAEPVVDLFVGKDAAFTAREIIGEGSECVYVYFNEAESKLAAHEGRDWWPCKIGCTSQALSHRLLQQNPGTSIGRPPVVGLVIKTPGGRGLERALHFALDGVKTRIDDAVGSEWFDTSPRKIKEWYLAHQQGLSLLQRTPRGQGGPK